VIATSPPAPRVIILPRRASGVSAGDRGWRRDDYDEWRGSVTDPGGAFFGRDNWRKDWGRDNWRN
jgi:hypothetical protein